jgi:hypothetical protein
MRWTFIGAELAVIVVCLGAIYGLGALVAGPAHADAISGESEQDAFRRSFPERFGGEPLGDGAVQGTTQLSTMALFKQPRPSSADEARQAKKDPSPIPSWTLYVMLIPIIGGVVYKTTNRQFENSAPAVEQRPQGDHDSRWNHYEMADAPDHVPATADARLSAAGARVYLCDLQEFAWKPGAPGWTFGKGGDLGMPGEARRISFHGKPPAMALSMHPPGTGYTRVCYYLGRHAQAFHGRTCLSDDDKPTKPKPTRFVVLGDGKLLWRSISSQDSNSASVIALDVSQVNILELRTYVEAGDSTGSHAVWFDPYVVVKK